MLLFDIGKVSRTKIFTKNKNFFSSFNNDRGLSSDDKTKDYFQRITVGLVHSLHDVTQLTVKICIFERSNEKNYFSKTKIIFYKKTTPQLLEHIGLQNMKVGVKTNLGDLPLFV